MINFMLREILYFVNSISIEKKKKNPNGLAFVLRFCLCILAKI